MQYREAGLRANRCELKDGAAYFEFLHGRTFEELLDEKRQEKDYGRACSELAALPETSDSGTCKRNKAICKKARNS